MNACFDGYIEGAELLLRIILDKPDIRVKSVTTQRQMKNLLGRDICLDIDADDDSGKKYNIEVQRSDKGADRKRARYHSSILDAHLLKSGEDYSDLPETFVIFITENPMTGRTSTPGSRRDIWRFALRKPMIRGTRSGSCTPEIR